MTTVDTSIDAARFRATLGHYPTGVALVTGIADDGEPVGMVVGSFTSVSLDPPLIAFLPTRTSARFERLRTASSFCVNVLAHDQGDLCRAFAGRGGNDFNGVSWSPSPSGAPVLDGVVAWIDCTYDSVLDGGDHYIALGEVHDLGVEKPVSPLLFFQGGYGRFSPASFLAPDQADVVAGVQLAESARQSLEELVADVPGEATAQVGVGDDIVVVAAAMGPRVDALTTLGIRVPLRPPIGEPYVAWQDEAFVERWLDRIVPLDPCPREEYVERLRLARERGWSMSLGGPDEQSHPSAPRMAQLLQEYSTGELTPARERELNEGLAQASKLYDPQVLEPEKRYDVRSMIAPVPDQDGKVRLMIRLSQLPPGQTGTQVQAWVDRLLQAARTTGERIAAAGA